MTDQEIRDALDVDPSPEFLARVRTRIAHEPEPSAWRWSWTMASAVALAAAIVIAVIVSRPAPRTTPAPEAVRAFGPADAVPSPGPAPVDPATSRSAGAVALHPAPVVAPRRAAVVSGFSRTVAIAPEILIDPREAGALRQLIAGVRDGRVDLAAAQRHTTPDPMALEPIAGLAIPLITVDSLTPSGEQGERQ